VMDFCIRNGPPIHIVTVLRTGNEAVC
jgi:hypothetical protein